MADNTTLPGAGDVIASDDIAGVKYQIVKEAFGALDSVTLVSAANPLPTRNTDGTSSQAVKAASTAAVAADQAAVVALSPNSPLPAGANTVGNFNYLDADVVATGTISVTDIVVAAPAGAGAFVSGTSTAGSYVFVAAPGGDSAWSAQITGLSAGTLYFEGSLDSTNGIDGQWININGRQTGIVNTVLAGNSTTNGMYRGNTSGIKYWRIRSVGALTGTPAIVVRLSGGIGAIFLNASIPAGTNVIGKTGIDQTTPGTTNLVALSAETTKVIGTVNIAAAQTVGLVAGAAVIGALTANQSINKAQINGIAPLMGNGITGTGSQRVTIASDNTAFPVNATLSAETTKVIGTVNIAAAQTLATVTTVSAVTAITNALPTGANVIGALTANQSINKAQINGVVPLMGNGVTGTGSQRVTVASDNTPFAVKIDQTTPGSTNQVTIQPSTLAVTVTAAANTAATATLPAVAGQFHYITGIEIMRTATAALAGTATLVVTTTNLPGSLAWSFGNAMAAGGTQRDTTLAFDNPLKSSVVNTATTIVMPAPGAAVLWRANVYYFTAA